MGAVKNGRKFTLVTFDLLALAVAVEVTLLAVVGFAMGIEVHRPTNRSPFVANRLALQDFELYFRPFTWLERDAHLIRLQS